MTENEILKQALEANNATILSLVDTIKKQDEAILKKDEEHRKETEALAARIKELTAQVAWLNRQLYGRKSEKLPVFDPNYPDLFAAEFGDLLKQAEEKRDEAVAQLPKDERQTPKQKRQVRRMLEDLPVLEQVRQAGGHRRETLQEDRRGGNPHRGA